MGWLPYEATPATLAGRPTPCPSLPGRGASKGQSFAATGVLSMRQSLKGVPGALDALERIGMEATRRAETLSVADFTALARETR